MEEQNKTPLVFYCQLAHGSPTGVISGFSNIKELYDKIGNCYGIDAKEIIFCTLNTHKKEMNMLLGGQIGLEDFIFAHLRGQAKEVEVFKTEETLGLTITDNGNGYAFIKRIRSDSIISRCPYIKVGDLIEKINEKSLIGLKHFEVAKALKEIPQNKSFTLRLVEPQSSGFGNLNSKRGGKKTQITSAKMNQTLRIRGNEPVVMELKSEDQSNAEEKINNLLENFMGIFDSDLASRIYELAISKSNTVEFAEAIDNSELEEFGFPDEFLVEIWGAVLDSKK